MSRMRLPLLAAVLLSTLLSVFPSPQTAGAAEEPSTTASASQRRGVWYAIGDTPDRAEVDAAAHSYKVIILNPWEGWALRRIKQLDPSVTVLMYKCLSSTRRYADGYSKPKPTGVGHAEAEGSNPAWFATDTTGARIEWRSYPDHWQMAVWDANYQRRWADNVTQEVVAGGWDGVLADNDFATLRHYSPALLAGTRTAFQTDAKIRVGLDAMVSKAGRTLQSRGKILVPNISDARLYPGRWKLHSQHGGAMEEQLGHWGTDPASGFIFDWPRTGWEQQTGEMSAPGISLAVTRAASGDRRTMLYGYSSVLVRGDASSYWTPSSTSAGTYTRPESIPEMSWPIGPPKAAGLRLSSGAWTRTFAGAVVVVNPTTRTLKVSVPAGFVDATGGSVTSVRLKPTSAVILKRR